MTLEKILRVLTVNPFVNDIPSWAKRREAELLHRERVLRIREESDENERIIRERNRASKG